MRLPSILHEGSFLLELEVDAVDVDVGCLGSHIGCDIGRVQNIDLLGCLGNHDERIHNT